MLQTGPLTSALQEGMRDAGRRGLVAAMVGHFTNDGGSIVFNVLIYDYLSFRIPLAYLGAVAAVSNLVSGLIAERIGSRADRSGKRGMMMAVGIGLIGAACLIFSASFYLSQSAAILLTPGVMLMGVGLAFYHPLGGSIIAFAVKGKRFSRQLGINGSFGSIGRALFPTLIVGVVSIFGAPVGLLALGGVIVAIGGVIYWLSRSFDGFMAGELQKQAPTRRSLRPYRRFVLSLTGVFLVNSVFSSGILTYIPTYYGQVYASGSVGGLITSVVLLTPIFGQPIQGYVTERLGGRRALQITVISSALVFILFLYSQDVVLQVLSLALLAFFVYTGLPVILGYATQMTPRESITRVNAIVWGFGSTIGTAVGSALGGTLGQIYGFHLSFTVCWLFGLLAIAFLPLVPRKIAEGPLVAGENELALSSNQ